GTYGEYGGSYVPPVLEPQLKKLAEFFDDQAAKEEFNKEFIYILKNYVGRPSALYYAKNLSDYVGSKIYLKREDLNHTGSHKINNCIGQILLAKKMGATEIIAETGAGQHAVATATAAAIFGIPCKIFMGEIDVERLALYVSCMCVVRGEVSGTQLGTRTLYADVDAVIDYS